MSLHLRSDFLTSKYAIPQMLKNDNRRIRGSARRARCPHDPHVWTMHAARDHRRGFAPAGRSGRRIADARTGRNNASAATFFASAW